MRALLGAGLLSLACAAGAAAAGVVQTHAGRLTGHVTARAGGLTVGDKAAVTDEILFAIFDAPGRTFRPPNTVRMTNGEVWHCEVLALAGGKLKLRSPHFGTKEVDRRGVQALEFQAKLPPDDDLEADTLYRASGEPLPGSLLWVSPTQVAIDSPLGAMAMDRSEATRFLLTKATRSAEAADKAVAVLRDGTVLRGELKLAAGRVLLKHETLGELSLPVKAVRSFLRHAPGVIYLTDLALSATAAPLLDATPSIRTVQDRRAGEVPAPAECVRCLTIHPATKLTVRLPAKPAGPRTFRATLAAAAGARGGVRLRLSAGGKTLLDRAIPASQAAGACISADLPGREVDIEVDFDEPVRFPCGIVLGDPHVVGK